MVSWSWRTHVEKILCSSPGQWRPRTHRRICDVLVLHRLLRCLMVSPGIILRSSLNTVNPFHCPAPRHPALVVHLMPAGPYKSSWPTFLHGHQSWRQTPPLFSLAPEPPKGKVLIDVEDGMHVDVSRHAPAPTSRQDTKSIGHDHMLGNKLLQISPGCQADCSQFGCSLDPMASHAVAPHIGSHLG